MQGFFDMGDFSIQKQLFGKLGHTARIFQEIQIKAGNGVFSINQVPRLSGAAHDDLFDGLRRL